jgi:hypothetical protein
MVFERQHVRLLICGIPGVGKTTFARWLEVEHGYRRCSRDELNNVQFGQCIEHALSAAEHVVIDWGFVASDPGFSVDFPVVRRLVNEFGVGHWWFDGDRGAALASFLSRGTVVREAWDAQLAGIEKHWAEIAGCFFGRILYVVSDGPRYATKEEILASLMEKPADSV